ncbi:hypothetical protein MBM_09228 [Drepanopeziza brunnea f. sp. 'multigermtubi' MB_m1]|uniref:Uncharacterized protein n=1 Tax=Marssonina brunnea f. sp. multigermtubi (strain MB_m1) TaxID=1072389 RepID=K1XJU5_MARBU|nr:uncharacterized protein MBM_09228 [Drepanopeziza brunnea f. sp. 'multigermtubi' MB_m1]EKD12659.1 hypothetical protein MBM_09228 [Drepanopeziza brunnea f. sp. 'multigermtubi' MB_m1]
MSAKSGDSPEQFSCLFFQSHHRFFSRVGSRLDCPQARRLDHTTPIDFQEPWFFILAACAAKKWLIKKGCMRRLLRSAEPRTSFYGRRSSRDSLQPTGRINYDAPEKFISRAGETAMTTLFSQYCIAPRIFLPAKEGCPRLADACQQSGKNLPTARPARSSMQMAYLCLYLLTARKPDAAVGPKGDSFGRWTVELPRNHRNQVRLIPGHREAAKEAELSVTRDHTSKKDPSPKTAAPEREAARKTPSPSPSPSIHPASRPKHTRQTPPSRYPTRPPHTHTHTHTYTPHCLTNRPLASRARPAFARLHARRREIGPRPPLIAHRLSFASRLASAATTAPRCAAQSAMLQTVERPRRVRTKCEGAGLKAGARAAGGGRRGAGEDRGLGDAAGRGAAAAAGDSRRRVDGDEEGEGRGRGRRGALAHLLLGVRVVEADGDGWLAPAPALAAAALLVVGSTLDGWIARFELKVGDVPVCLARAVVNDLHPEGVDVLVRRARSHR